MAEVTFEQWQQFLMNHPQAHLLQTAQWGLLKSSFGWTAKWLIQGESGIQLLFRRLPFGFTLAYAPKPASGFENLLPAIDEICRQQKAIFLKVEPNFWETEFNPSSTIQTAFNPSPHSIQPPRTVIVSLEGSEEDILARMKQKCRYNIRLAEKKGVTVRAWDDLNGFHRLMQITGGRDGFGVHSLAYYQKAYQLFKPTGMAEILVAEFEGKPLAALMVFAVGKLAYYLYGASTNEERNRMPAYILQWEAMKWAKAIGCSEYDLWGVPDAPEEELEANFETRSDGLWGVYRFKRGFGGQVLRAAQSLDRVYMPFFYRLYLWRFGSQGD